MLDAPDTLAFLRRQHATHASVRSGTCAPAELHITHACISPDFTRQALRGLASTMLVQSFPSGQLQQQLALPATSGPLLQERAWSLDQDGHVVLKYGGSWVDAPKQADPTVFGLVFLNTSTAGCLVERLTSAPGTMLRPSADFCPMRGRVLVRHAHNDQEVHSVLSYTGTLLARAPQGSLGPDAGVPGSIGFLMPAVYSVWAPSGLVCMFDLTPHRLCLWDLAASLQEVNTGSLNFTRAAWATPASDCLILDPHEELSGAVVGIVRLGDLSAAPVVMRTTSRDVCVAWGSRVVVLDVANWALQLHCVQGAGCLALEQTVSLQPASVLTGGPAVSWDGELCATVTIDSAGNHRLDIVHLVSAQLLRLPLAPMPQVAWHLGPSLRSSPLTWAADCTSLLVSDVWGQQRQLVRLAV